MISGHTFESLDEHVAALPPLPATPSTTGVDAEPKAAALNLCEVWRRARPIALFLFSLPFIPSRWRVWLELIVESLDATCPAPQP